MVALVELVSWKHTQLEYFQYFHFSFIWILVRWFRGSKDASADLESGFCGSHLAASILRHGSFKSRRSDGIGRSIQRVRRRVERRLGRIGLGKGKKVVGGVPGEAPGSCKNYISFLKKSFRFMNKFQSNF